MKKTESVKVLSKYEAIALACDAAKFCGISQNEIALICAVMDARVDTFLRGPTTEILPQENHAT